jgi:hypothetical protein
MVDMLIFVSPVAASPSLTMMKLFHEFEMIAIIICNCFTDFLYSGRSGGRRGV